VTDFNDDIDDEDFDDIDDGGDLVDAFLDKLGDRFPAVVHEMLDYLWDHPDHILPASGEAGPGDEVVLPRATPDRLDQVADYEMTQALTKAERYLHERGDDDDDDMDFAREIAVHIIRSFTASLFVCYPQAGARMVSITRRLADGTYAQEFRPKGIADPDARDRN
jgi:hypothetical protein